MHTQQPGTALPDYHVDPYRLLEDDLKTVYDEIRYVSTEFVMLPIDLELFSLFTNLNKNLH